jgi:predicted alpha/beta superfamily hydrolase
MKLSFSIVAVFLLLLVACKHQHQDNQIVIGKIDSIKSNILGEERKIWVYVPEGASDPKKRFPVVYLLDGDDHFTPVKGIIQYLSENEVCPNMILVGIPNTDRTRDLTPTKSLYMPDGTKTDAFKTSGGGEKFESFIEKELIPHIDSVYPVAPYKMLIGHSFGGLTVMNIVINHTDMFNSYVAIDPSMWWDNKKLLNKAQDVLSQKKFAGKSLFLAIANTMPGAMDTLQVRIDTTGNTSHIRSILALKDILQRNPADGLAFSYKYYKDDNHGSVPLIAEYDAFHFLFSYYKMPHEMDGKLFDRNIQFDPAAAYSAHYEEVSKHMGYTVLPPEDAVAGLGNYYYQHANFPQRGYAMLMLNLKNYPASFDANNNMGDYYDHQKDKAKAIEYYTKALAIKDNPDTRKKLDKLTGKK